MSRCFCALTDVHGVRYVLVRIAGNRHTEAVPRPSRRGFGRIQRLESAVLAREQRGGQEREARDRDFGRHFTERGRKRKTEEINRPEVPLVTPREHRFSTRQTTLIGMCVHAKCVSLFIGQLFLLVYRLGSTALFRSLIRVVYI